MTRCRIPAFRKRYKIDIGIYDVKTKEFFLGQLNREAFVYSFIKNHYCVIWMKNRRDGLLKGVDELDKNFEYDKI